METMVVIGRTAFRLGSGAWTVKLWWDLFAATFVAHTDGLGRLATGALLLIGFDLMVKVGETALPYALRHLKSRLHRTNLCTTPS